MGTYRDLSIGHAPRYLVEFRYRYNGRVNPAAVRPRIAHVSSHRRSVPWEPVPWELRRLPGSKA